MKTTPRELSKEDIGWLAGIIDGECSIVYGRFNNPDKIKGRGSIYWGLHLINTSLEMIEKFQKIVNILGYPATESRKLRYFKKDYHTRYGAMSKGSFKPIVGVKQCHEITVRNQDILVPVLESVLPHLTEKRVRAIALVEFLKGHKKHKRYSQEAIDRLVETKRTTPAKDDAIVRTS